MPTELELLNLLASGKTDFTIEEFPDLDRIEKTLHRFTQKGYTTRMVRAIYRTADGLRLMRIAIFDGLTPGGEERRRQLSDLEAMPLDEFWIDPVSAVGDYHAEEALTASECHEMVGR